MKNKKISKYKYYILIFFSPSWTKKTFLHEICAAASGLSAEGLATSTQRTQRKAATVHQQQHHQHQATHSGPYSTTVHPELYLYLLQHSLTDTAYQLEYRFSLNKTTTKFFYIFKTFFYEKIYKRRRGRPRDIYIYLNSRETNQPLHFIL